MVESIANDYPTRFAALTMHVNGDHYSLPWSQTRLDVFYGLAAAVPTFMVDALWNCQTPASYRTYVEQQLGVSTNVTLELSGEQHSGSTWDLTARVCRSGGSLPARVFIAPTLDNHPELPSYSTNVLMQQPSQTDVTIPSGGCVDVTNRVTFDSLSMSNSSNIVIIAWAQAQASSAPTDVYQAGIMRWPFPAGSRLSTIEITPATATVTVGGSVDFTAVGYDQHGGEFDLANPTWSLGAGLGDGDLDPRTGSTTTTFTGTEPGSRQVLCTEDGVTGGATVSVQEAPYLDTIEIDPATTTVAVDGEVVFTATGKDQYGADFSLDDPVWSIEGTGDGTFDPATGTTTTFTGTYPGAAAITCTEGEVSANAAVEVTGDAPQLETITVTPATVSLRVGDDVELTAAGTDQYGRAIELAAPVWRVEGTGDGTFDPDDAAATTFTATAAGSAQLICSDDGVEGEAAAEIADEGLPAPRRVTGRVTPS